MWVLVLCVIIVCVAFSPDFRRIGAQAFFTTANVARDLMLLAVILILIVTFGQWAAGQHTWGEPQKVRWEVTK